MNKTLKKTLSIILTILMIVTTVPFAFAAEGDVVMLELDGTTTYHGTLKDAFEAGKTGTADAPAKITLLQSTEEKVSVNNSGVYILELNGNSISSNYYTLDLSGDMVVTIKDSVGDGGITATEYGVITIEDSVELTILSGTITGDIMNSSGLENEATLNIEGGTFNNENNYNYNVSSAAKYINISGGEFNSNGYNINIKSWNSVKVTGSPVFKATLEHFYFNGGTLDLSEHSFDKYYFDQYAESTLILPKCYGIKDNVIAKNSHTFTDSSKCDICGDECAHENLTDGKCDACGDEFPNTIILYTNDIHCSVDDYPALAAYRAELISQGDKVIIVDAGDAISGDAYSNGDAIVEIMNAVGYDYAVPGDYEFDYGVESFFNLAENKAEYKYTSSNLHYLPSVDPVFDPYVIKDFGDYQIAFIGISTPETIDKQPGDCFKDENNNYIYGFPIYPGGLTNEDIYENVQESVDDAIAKGADIVVAVGHLGIEGVTEGWKSTDVIANTTGIDYFIDAHSHEAIESEVYKNKDGETVTLTSGGKNFEYFGQITLGADGSVEFDLINPDTVNVDSLTESAKSEYSKVKALVDNYYTELEAYYKEIEDAVAELENVIADLDKKIDQLVSGETFKAKIEAIKEEIEALKADNTTTKEDVAELLERVNAIAETINNCVNGVHSFTDYTESEAARCGENAKETAYCDNGCGATDTIEVEGTMLEHEDENGDYLCDHDCGYEFEKPVDPDCDHLCHKTGFVGFIWKIVRFFWKLFRMNPTCSCGAAHY